MRGLEDVHFFLIIAMQIITAVIPTEAKNPTIAFVRHESSWSTGEL